VRPRLMHAAAVALCTLVGACATVLGLADYKDAAAELCACPGFEQIDSVCVARAHSMLAIAPEGAREVWLARYDALDCPRCDHAAECYNDIPGCADRTSGCECCVWKGTRIECPDVHCTKCRSCTELAYSLGTKKPDCVSARTKLNTLKTCACANCAEPCGPLCQPNAASLSMNPMDVCRQCLAAQCSSAVDACMADKGG
jgi:hypothetical protein